jgi:hypothetical protein
MPGVAGLQGAQSFDGMRTGLAHFDVLAIEQRVNVVALTGKQRLLTLSTPPFTSSEGHVT